IAGAAGRLREDGVTVYAGHLDGTPMDGIRPAERRAFMIGNEGAGLRETTAAAADMKIRIPMKGATESLNAAVCAALFTYWGTI
ncbi:MAG: 23S rRNA (guanosine(2251)-2'-O)-methyltransferase RlmB, partial [Lachnospiraceae bacterium]|nr:23S rRNA (guanosine(2251)-2'-O)-methyltransferase RlmB [Lachnospiraceae bacterium]